MKIAQETAKQIHSFYGILLSNKRKQAIVITLQSWVTVAWETQS